MSHRTQITLTDEQYARLLAESERTGLGLAELTRRALDRVYPSVVEDSLAEFMAAAGTWGAGTRGQDHLSPEQEVDRLRPGHETRQADMERALADLS